jgi:hypothetical protein
MMLAVSRDDKLAFAPCSDAVLLHEAAYSLLAHAVTTGYQFLPHFWPTVFMFDLCVDGSNFNQQAFIARAAVHPRLGGLVYVLATPMFKVTTGGNSPHVAGQGDGPAPLSFPLALGLTQLSRLALGMPRILAVTDTA